VTAAALRRLIAERAPLVVPSIYDGISALLVRDLGFEAAYVGSYATGATRYGLPDVGYVGLDDMADQVRRLSDIVEVPLVVDGEAGWGNVVHVARAVRVLEAAGAAAVHIEDHVFGKHLTSRPKVTPLAEALDRLKAALDSRRSNELMIIGRTDAPGAEGPAAAVDRALAFQEAGADGLFIAGPLDDASYARLKAERRVPVFTTNARGMSAAAQAERGSDVVLYFAVAHIAAKMGMEAALRVLRDEQSVVGLEDGLDVRGFDEFLGVAAVKAMADQYGLLDE
jgi:2-methylisocitrate lyase-like PEP mutase family enzyme